MNFFLLLSFAYVEHETTILQLARLGVETQLRTRLLDDGAPLPETDQLVTLRQKLRHTAQSEGYETMTQGSSDIVSEVNK